VFAFHNEIRRTKKDKWEQEGKKEKKNRVDLVQKEKGRGQSVFSLLSLSRAKGKGRKREEKKGGGETRPCFNTYSRPKGGSKRASSNA